MDAVKQLNYNKKKKYAAYCSCQVHSILLAVCEGIIHEPQKNSFGTSGYNI